MAWIILSPALGGGLPEGSAAHRYEFELWLDGQGVPRQDAWLADEKPWNARRLWPDEEELRGDVQFDEDYGWALRFFRRDGEAPDAPLQSLFRIGTRFRPGEVVALTEADGREYPWRVVSVA